MTGRVLILDGSLTVRMDLHEALAAAGLDAMAVATAEEARDALASAPFDVALVEPFGPGPAAAALLGELAAGRDGGPVPLVLADPGRAERLPGLVLPASAFVGRPYDRAALVEQVRGAIAGRAAAGPVVLVIDDSATLREAMREALAGAGYRPVLAATGEEGLRLAGAVRPDLLVIDGHLPGISGAMVIGRIRMDPALRRVPCLLLTGSEAAGDELEALEAGADAYARKSQGTDLVLARVQALLRAGRGPDAIDRGPAVARVLVAEAPTPWRDGLAAALRAEGLLVSPAGTAAELYEALDAAPPDAVLLGEGLPGPDATSLARTVKAWPGWRDVPLVILGRADGPAPVLEALAAGADDFVARAEGLEVVMGRVRARLRRKRAEDENRRIRDELLAKEVEAARAEAGTRAKTAFLAMVSHEIRTPLNALLGVADLLAASPLDARQRGWVELLRRSGGHLAAIVNDVLDLSKVEAGKLELEHVPFSLREVVRCAAALAAVKADEKGLAVRWDVAADVPDDLIGDPLRLSQVLDNLLANAVKFTASGAVDVTVARDPADPAPGALRVAVMDSGVGIPPERRDAIFEDYAQAEAATARMYGGTGLGLPITRRLVEAMGGRIGVEAAPGGGSTFAFSLKLAVGAPPVPVAEPQPAAGPRALEVLVAEDVEDNRTIFQAYLTGTPHHVVWAENGAVALERFREGRFDVVLMDLQMPVMDGYAATRAVREWEREHGRVPTPIVALTASALGHEVAAAAAAGCTAHLAKPINRRNFLRALEAYV